MKKSVLEWLGLAGDHSPENGSIAWVTSSGQRRSAASSQRDMIHFKSSCLPFLFIQRDRRYMQGLFDQ